MQIYGTKKCPVTRKAERFFRERGIFFQFMDLNERGLSRGELENIRRGAGGAGLIDPAGAAYRKRGLAYMDFDETEEILADPLLLATPVVREGGRSVVGDNPAGWKALAGSISGG